MVRLTDRPNMTLGVYRGRKTTIQQQQFIIFSKRIFVHKFCLGQKISQISSVAVRPLYLGSRFLHGNWYSGPLIVIKDLAVKSNLLL